MSNRLTHHKVDASEPVTAGPGQLTTAVRINLLRNPLSGRNPRISHRQVETPHHELKELFIETLCRR